jgi:iron complex outermembrane receptor protein
MGTRQTGTLTSSFVWNYDLALYNTEVKNEIVPYQGGRFYFTAGRARRSGAELGASLQSSSGLGAHSALTLNRHRYVTYVVDSVHYGVPGATADYSGNKVVGVPDVMLGGELFYQPTLLPGARLEVGARHTGSYFADDANSVVIPSQTVFDGGVSIAYTLRDGASLRARVAVDNLTDKRYVASAFLNPDRNSAGEAVAFEPGLPRTVVVSFSITRAK